MTSRWSWPAATARCWTRCWTRRNEPSGCSTVRRFMMGVETGEEDGVADLLHEEIEIHDFDLPDAGVYHGLEGIGRWLADWDAPWDEWSAHAHDFLDLGTQVATLNRLQARTASGLAVDREDSQLFTLRSGKIAKLEYFGDARDLRSSARPIPNGPHCASRCTTRSAPHTGRHCAGTSRGWWRRCIPITRSTRRRAPRWMPHTVATTAHDGTRGSVRGLGVPAIRRRAADRRRRQRGRPVRDAQPGPGQRDRAFRPLGRGLGDGRPGPDHVPLLPVA